jgi:hypothetical protein
MASIFYIISIMLFWLYFRKVEMPEEQTLRIKQNVLK